MIDGLRWLRNDRCRRRCRLRIRMGVQLGRHFDDQRHAKQFFSEPANINEEMKNIVRSLLLPFVP